MAKARKTTRNPRRKSSAGSRSGAPNDAIALLKSDHRQVEEWFEEFQSSHSGGRKEELTQSICQALKVHTQIEHEVFYPAFLRATGEKDIHHEAEIEHDAAERLIAEIEQASPEDEYQDARVKVLADLIKHHVNEEERRGGMFAKARQSGMDLRSLGEELAARKERLMGSDGEERSMRRSRTAETRQETRSTPRQ
jgi:hypothetical protein